MSVITQTTTTAKLQEMSRQSKQLPTIGTQSWWSITGVKIGREQLLDHCKNLDIDLGWVPPEMTKRRAFIRACRSFAGVAPVVIAENGKIIVDKLDDSDERIGFVFTLETLQARQDPDFGTINRAWLSKSTGKLQLEGRKRFPFWGELLNRYLDALNYLHSQDVRQMILGIIRDRLDGIGLRPNGGFYFTPAEHDKALEKIEQLIPLLGGDSIFYTLGIVNAQKERANMWKAFEAEMLGDLEQATAQIQEMLAPDANTKDATLARQFQLLNKARSKAEMYEEALHRKADVVKDKIKHLQNKVASAMTMDALVE